MATGIGDADDMRTAHGASESGNGGKAVEARREESRLEG